jgi:hypothetical protein
MPLTSGLLTGFGKVVSVALITASVTYMGAHCLFQYNSVANAVVGLLVPWTTLLIAFLLAIFFYKSLGLTNLILYSPVLMWILYCIGLTMYHDHPNYGKDLWFRVGKGFVTIIVIPYLVVGIAIGICLGGVAYFELHPN